MLANQARRFGETLVDRHVLSRDDLEQAIDVSERTKEPLPSVLLRLDLVGSKDLTAALAEQMGVRFIDFLETPIHQDAPETLSAELARQYVAVPVDFEGQKLVVAFAEPPSDTALTAVGHATSFEVIPAVADRSELMRAIAMIYGAVDGDAPEFNANVVVGEEQLDDELHINDLLDLVIQWGGSDLHLASGSPPVIRVNGDLRPVTELPIFNGSQIRQMVFSILTQKQREKFENELELDTSYALPGRGRF
ncbi:MAG TPA: hypothetical protein VIK54_15490, partial [Acidimicrobiia bacterium]